MSYAEEPRADDVLYAELRANWNDIFPSGNRNAGGAMFFKYTLDNYKDYNEFLSMNRFYCPVSGSFVPPDSEPEFVKNTWLKSSGRIRQTRSANSKDPGWPSWKCGV